MDDLPIQTYQQRLSEMVNWLKQGLDLKLQKPLQPDAQKRLRQAYKLAREPEPLDAPWPQITAYRLAHVLMRDGRATDWGCVDGLLREAAEGNMLGPVPLIYRLIALSKRNPEGEPTKEMIQIYQLAQTGLATIDRPAADNRPYANHKRPLQLEWLNLLEAVIYMTGLDYDPIAGRVGTDPFAGLGFESSGWRVIEDADSAQVLYPEAVARKVLEQRLKDRVDVLTVEIVAEGRNMAIERHSPRKEVTRNSLRGRQAQDLLLRGRQAQDLLALMLGNRSLLRPDPASDANDPRSSIRQRKKRLRENLQRVVEELENQPFDDWWENPLNRRPSALPPIILLVGPEARKAIERARR